MKGFQEFQSCYHLLPAAAVNEDADHGIVEVFEAQIAENPDRWGDENQADQQVRPKKHFVGMRENIPPEKEVQSDNEVDHIKRKHKSHQPDCSEEVKLHLFELPLNGPDRIRKADSPQQG